MGWSSNCAGATGFQLLQSLSTLIHLFPHVQCITPHRSSLSVWLAVWEKGIKTKPLSQIRLKSLPFTQRHWLWNHSVCSHCFSLAKKHIRFRRSVCDGLGQQPRSEWFLGFTRELDHQIHSRAWELRSSDAGWGLCSQPVKLLYSTLKLFHLCLKHPSKLESCGVPKWLQLHVLKMGDKLSWVLSL